MKLLSIFIALVVIAVTSCDKDKIETIPRYNFDSISPGTVVSGDILQIKGSYTDKEGDIDSVFIVRKYFDGDNVTKVDTIERIEFATLGVPAKTVEADMDITFEYNTFNTGLRLLSGVSKDTTAAFGVILQDKVPNRSVYVETSKVRLIKP